MPGSHSVRTREASFTATGEMPVRLGALEGQSGLQIEDCHGGTRWLEREGSLVRSSTGERARSFTFEPAEGARGVRIDGRSYRGRLVVEPHPTSGLRVTNHVELEDYVEGVVASEVILWSAEPAELEAQAVAARTYALVSLDRQPNDPFLWDDTRDQAYRGIFLPVGAGEERVALKLARAIEVSQGTVLWANGELYDARFHASCGGHTATLGDVFPAESLIFGGAVPCVPCRSIGASELGGGNGKVAWTAHFEPEALDRLARDLRIGNRLLSLHVTRKDAFGRWLAVLCQGDRGSRVVEWKEIRRILGAGILKSGMLSGTSPAGGERIRDGMTFEGVGRGHGVGLCQVGTHAFAIDGWTATEILAHYYPIARPGPLPRTSL